MEGGADGVHAKQQTIPHTADNSSNQMQGLDHNADTGHHRGHYGEMVEDVEFHLHQPPPQVEPNQNTNLHSIVDPTRFGLPQPDKYRVERPIV